MTNVINLRILGTFSGGNKVAVKARTEHFRISSNEFEEMRHDEQLTEFTNNLLHVSSIAACSWQVLWCHGGLVRLSGC